MARSTLLTLSLALALAAVVAAATTARIHAVDLLGAVVADVSMPVPPGGLDGWALMQAAHASGALTMASKHLGPVPVVYTLNGRSHDLRTTTWCLDYAPAGAPRALNVGMRATTVRPGDALMWSLQPMGKCSSRAAPTEPAEASAAEAEEGEEEEEGKEEAGEEEL